MLTYHLLLFYRQLQRQRLFSFINILGLSLGITSSLLIYLYINQELSYDHFHSDADRIFRINQTFIWGEGNDISSSTGPGVAFALESEIPEFEQVTRIHTPGRMLVSLENQGGNEISFDEESVLAVDSNFFQVFSFPLIRGDVKEVLEEPGSIVLTNSTARRYFGDRDPMGEVLLVRTADYQRSFEVTGITSDPPSNSIFV